MAPKSSRHAAFLHRVHEEPKHSQLFVIPMLPASLGGPSAQPGRCAPIANQKLRSALLRRFFPPELFDLRPRGPQAALRPLCPAVTPLSGRRPNPTPTVSVPARPTAERNRVPPPTEGRLTSRHNDTTVNLRSPPTTPTRPRSRPLALAHTAWQDAPESGIHQIEDHACD